MAKKETSEEIIIHKIEQGRIVVCVLGRSPLLANAMSAKAQRTLLLPSGKKTAVEKQSTLKHSPIEEFRNSTYRAEGDDVPTRCLLRGSQFKAAMRSAALDIPGAAKAQIGRLTYVDGDFIDLFGVPELHMTTVRSADMNRTPDIRTRAIFPEWACRLSVSFVMPILREATVINLLAAAGVMRGVGDFRPEKGAGSFGQFELVSPDDKRFVALMKHGRQKQDAALESPKCYDGQTAELLSWFNAETKRRGFKVIA